MKNRLTTGFVAALVLCATPSSGHVLFTNEAQFIKAVDALRYGKIFESFEAAVWGPAKRGGAPGLLLSQGLSWSGSTNLTTAHLPGWICSGGYAIFDDSRYPHGIEVTGHRLYAVGGYFIEWSQLDIHFLLDGESRAYFGVGSDRRQFCGILEPNGFDSITIQGTAAFDTVGGWLADDFVFVVPGPAEGAMSLQISVNGNPDPQYHDYAVAPSETLVLSIHSVDGYVLGDDVLFSLCAEASRGSISGGVAVGAPPGSSIDDRLNPKACDFCPPGEEGIGGLITNVNGTSWPPGVYFDNIVYHFEAPGNAVIRLYTTVDFVNIALADSVIIRQKGLDCVKSTAPEYADWVAWGSPDCWCCRYQCRGDADCRRTGPFPIALPDLNMLRAAINKPDALLAGIPDGICCDFDHRRTGPFRVDITDLNIFRLYNKGLPPLLPCCDLDGDCILTSEDKYNFWRSP